MDETIKRFARVPETLISDPNVIKMLRRPDGMAGLGLFLALSCQANQRYYDEGYIPTVWAETIPGYSQAAMEELILAGMVDVADDGEYVHITSWLDWHASLAETAEKRKRAAAARAARRAS